MTTKANISQFKIYLGTTASPPVYNAIEEVKDITGLGQSNTLVDVTNFDSAGVKEYIGGNADGVELTVKCNRIPETSPPGQQENLVLAVTNKQTRSFQIKFTGETPNKTWTFLAVCKDWKVAPSVSDANQLEFVLKITGAITLS